MNAWPKVRIGEVASIDRCSIAPKDISDDTWYVGLENIERGGRLVGVRTAGEADLQSQKYLFTKEHILFGKLRPYLEKVSRPGFDGVCSTDVLPIKAGKEVLRDYLMHFLLHPDTIKLATLRATGINLPRISPAELVKFQLPLPPLDEQEHIATVLNRAMTLRDKRRATIALLDSVAQSIFSETFGNPVRNEKGWERVPFSSLLDRIDSGYSPPCLDRPVQAGEWGVLKLGAVTTCEYMPDQNKALPPSTDVYTYNEVKVGDLLFTRKNTHGLIAASAFVEVTPPKLLLPDLLFRLVIKHSAPIDKRYLHHLLIDPTKRRKVQALASGSAGSMPNISKTRLMKLPIELPALEMQREFARRMQALESLRSVYQTHLMRLDELFGSLQHSVFKGEL